MNICVCGYYGMGNFGDELFLETLKQVFAHHNVFAWQDSLDPSKIDVVIIGGGDIITPYHYNEYYFPAALKDHPTWIYGVGIVRHYEESTWPQKEVNKYRERVKKAIRFVVRDEKSQEVASRLGLHENVEYHPDLAFSYRQTSVYPINKSKYRKLLGVCVYSYSSYPLNSMAALLADYVKEGYQIIFIPMVNQNNTFTDVPTCKLLKEKVEEQVGQNRTLLLSPRYDLNLIHSWIRSLDYFISSKLHPSLVALIEGVPVLCLSDQGKVSSLMEAFSLGEYALSIHTPQHELKETMDSFLLESREKFMKAAPLVQESVVESDRNLKKLKEEIELYYISRQD